MKKVVFLFSLLLAWPAFSAGPEFIGTCNTIAWEPVMLKMDGLPATDLIGYKLYIDGQLAKSIAKPATSTPCAGMGLTVGQRNATVTAYTPANESLQSLPAPFVITQAPPPPPVDVLTLTVSVPAGLVFMAPQDASELRSMVVMSPSRAITKIELSRDGGPVFRTLTTAPWQYNLCMNCFMPTEPLPRLMALKVVATAVDGATATAIVSIQVNPFTETLPPPPPPVTMYSLATTKIGTGIGAVASLPFGSSFASGTIVSITAVPATGSTFAGWTGACSGASTCTVTMSANQTVTAQFDLIPPPPPISIRKGLTVIQTDKDHVIITWSEGTATGRDCKSVSNVRTGTLPNKKITIVCTPP